MVLIGDRERDASLRENFPRACSLLLPASLQIDFVVRALQEKSRSLRAGATAYSKGEKYAEKYDPDDGVYGFIGNRKRDASSCGHCARPNSAPAADKLQLGFAQKGLHENHGRSSLGRLSALKGGKNIAEVWFARRWQWS